MPIATNAAAPPTRSATRRAFRGSSAGGMHERTIESAVTANPATLTTTLPVGPPGIGIAPSLSPNFSSERDPRREHVEVGDEVQNEREVGEEEIGLLHARTRGREDREHDREAALHDQGERRRVPARVNSRERGRQVLDRVRRRRAGARFRRTTRRARPVRRATSSARSARREKRGRPARRIS